VGLFRVLIVEHWRTGLAFLGAVAAGLILLAAWHNALAFTAISDISSATLVAASSSIPISRFEGAVARADRQA